MLTQWRKIETPAGTVLLIVAAGTMRVEFVSLKTTPPTGTENNSLMPAIAHWLAKALLQPPGPAPVPVPDGPPFWKACWTACRKIPFGQTRTYAELAAMAGRPCAARAAGSAMRQNPTSLLTPCHRIVGAADLGGFAGQRQLNTPHLQLKRRLLALEADCSTA
ncbi:MAG: MGMT family protein [Phycisphaerales bacterium]|nr:MGMT family protein [Phycisphaerales bacterium]